MWTETQRLLINAHRRMLGLLKQRPDEASIDRLTEVTFALNSEGVVYLGGGHYEQAPYLVKASRRITEERGGR